ncbi:MAG: hypothetical protein H5T41_09400 [Methanomassiliicoccales archaeon]|nr:hypothetical protein [Methanomassiliicoccales archaeon]
MSVEENVSNETNNLTSFICERIKENEEFLNKNAKDVYEEVIGFINDAIDLAVLLAKRLKAEEAITHPLVFFAMHVFMPMSYGIYVNLLIGNLPACFMELRLIHETMAKCYVAEKVYPGQEDFATKLEALEQVLKEEEISISKLMKELGSDFIALWGKLSEGWVHPRGILKRVTSSFVGKKVPPSWSIVIPMTYTEEDLDDIKELGKRVAEFRALLKTVITNCIRE